MRKLVTTAFVSLDGVMQAPGGPEEDTAGGFAHGGWTVTYWDDAMGEVMGRTFEAPFELVLGRKTYDIFAAHWPRVKDEPIADAFNRVTKHVATRSASSLDWRNSVTLGGDVAAELARLKQQDGPTLLLQGSGDLIQTLLARDLIDEFTLLVFPLLLGKGKRLFGPGTIPAALTLVDSRVSTTGVVMCTYRRAGDIVTGSFALEP